MSTLENLLDIYGVDYITTGQNSSADFVNINCVGGECVDDQKYKLGVHRSLCYGYCWADGKIKVFDIAKSLGIPWREWSKAIDEASDEWEIEYSDMEPLVDIDDDEADIFVPGEPLKEVHKEYLRGRGFNPEWLEKEFGVRGTGYLPYIPGEACMAHMIVIPIHYQNRIISYLGRSIQKDPMFRYICCHETQELRFHKRLFFNLDKATSKKVILVEGTFDAMKLIQASGNFNIIASYGTAIKPEQLLLLRERYDEVIVLFDPEEKAQGHADEIVDYMSQFGKQAVSITLQGEEDNDPGKLDLPTAKFLVEALLGKTDNEIPAGPVVEMGGW